MGFLPEKLVDTLLGDLSGKSIIAAVVCLAIGVGAGVSGAWTIAASQAANEIAFVERQNIALERQIQDMERATATAQARIKDLQAELSEQEATLATAQSSIADLTAKLDLPETLAARCALFDGQIAKIDAELTKLTMELSVASPMAAFPRVLDDVDLEKEHPRYATLLTQQRDTIERLADLKQRLDDCLTRTE